MLLEVPTRVRFLTFAPRDRRLKNMNDTALSISEHATHSRRWLVPLALATVYVVWGSTYLGIRYGLTGFPPFVLAALRFGAAGVAMYAWLRLRGVPAPTRRQWRNAAITGVLLLAFGSFTIHLVHSSLFGWHCCFKPLGGKACLETLPMALGQVNTAVFRGCLLVG